MDRFTPLLNGWRLSVSDRPSSPKAIPFALAITLSRTKDGYTISSEWTDGTQVYGDEADIVCTFFADLIMAHAAENKTLVHLHAGAVQLGDRLLVFPSDSKGGKSTLSASLRA